MEKNIKSSAINYGLYLGGILALVTILAYAFDIGLLTKWWLGIIILLIVIVFGIISTIKAKGLQNGFLSFKEAFSSYFITAAIGIIISMAASVILFNFIDPEAATVLKEKTIETTAEMMQNFNAPEEVIEETIAKMEAQDNQFSLISQLKSTAFYIVFQAVIGLIVGLILKKTDPNAE